MILATKPVLKIIDKNKLHITRRPRLTSWLLLFLSVIVLFEIFRRLTDSVFFTIVSLLGEIMFGLDTLGEWEDLVLDKNRNTAAITRCTWSEKLITGDSTNSERFVKLSDIRHVGVSMNMGLFFVCRDGETIALDTRGLSREEIQNHRKEINYFLNMNKIEFLNDRRLDPYERIVATSDSENEIALFPRLHDCRSIGSARESRRKISRFEDSIVREKYLAQETLSTPSSEGIRHKSQDHLLQPNPKRGRFTENSIVEDLTSARSRHGYDLDRPGR